MEKYSSILGTEAIYVFTLETRFPDSTVHSRMFAPTYGVPEDPATGSASGPLGCYLVKHKISNGKNIVCEQGFEIDRPSMIYVNIKHEKGKITQINVARNSEFSGKGIIHI